MNPELNNKSIHDLRVMAQAFGIDDIFQKDALHLMQEIEQKQQTIFTTPTPVIEPPQYDARLMTKPPSKRSNAIEITELLAGHIKAGLKLSFDEHGERWFMAHGKKTDEGTVRMPLRHVLYAADKVMK